MLGRLRRVLLASVVAWAFVLVCGGGVALANAGWWHLGVSARPSFLPAEGPGQIVVTAANRGDGPVEAAGAPVTIDVGLPAHVRAVGIASGGAATLSCPHGGLSCTFAGVLQPYHQLEVVVSVEVMAGAETGEASEASVSGGGVAGASASHLLTISGEVTPFGLQSNELELEEEGGAPDLRAGSHPFQLTDTIVLNQLSKPGGDQVAYPAGLPKDVGVKLPPGLVGNPIPFPQCTVAQFLTFDATESENACSPQTAVGVATVHVDEPIQTGNSEYVLPVFNLEPNFGEPARFGFYVPEGHVPVFLDTSVRGGPGTGEEYAITASSSNVSETAGFLSSEVSFWGVPGSPTHNNARGWNCIHEAQGLPTGPCQPLEAQHTPSFLTMPTQCTGGALESSTELSSWAAPGELGIYPTTLPMQTLEGCNQLSFAPSIQAQPSTASASSPSGLNFSLGFDDEGLTTPEGLAESQLKSTVVTLPEGFTINPSAGVGLGGCTPAEYAAESLQSPEAGCPADSKLGTVEASTPLLTQALEGSLFVAQPYENPFPEPEAGHPGGTLVALYIVLKNPETGVMIKLAGKVTPNPVTGQLTTSFEATPQFPISHFNLHFREGQQAPLISPATCGTYTTEAQLYPWSQPTSALSETSSFTITSGVGGGPCPSGGTAPFSPGIEAGTLNNNAGMFSSFYLRLTRGDGDQEISGFSTDMPNGLTGRLTGIPYCPQAGIEAARHVTGAQEETEPSCPVASEIGHTLVGTGVGAVLAYVPGKVYLAGPYNGDPFSLVSITSAKVGPFDLGTVVLRFALAINPRTAQVSVDPTASEPIPTIIDGIVTHVRDIRVYINRANFILNPTGCEAKAISSTLTAGEGATATVSSPFQAASCANLKFTPKIAVSTGGHASKLDGASLAFKISYPAGALGTQSWFKETKFDIPKQLPARLETLQRSCLAKVFEANPAGCPPAATIGHATVHTPLLPVPLAGPVYFVSYGGAKFPEAVIVLQGDGVTFDLHGETFINKKTGVTSATFRNTPDVPFENIEVTIPTGRYSEFGANVPAKDYYSLCGQKLTMPTLLKAQNGLQINQNTPITITGCTKPKPKKHSKHSKPKKHAKHK
jgi:hypothetical protein